MTELKCKTRGNSSPNRKPKVFFTCHPDDFSLYFNSITEDILRFFDCAFFYYDSAFVLEDIEEYRLDLENMQLFVVPVTAKLLKTPNTAMEFDVPFAVEHNIPVLPLMQEGGLDKLYTAKFGNTQYLDKQNTDATAIGFYEKLIKFLNSVLVGDKLAKQIREAFDAYIFLSYRKKDRKYAQKLMRLIHQNDFCRDIAIWYDEFLNPGENFSDAIEEALNKSELFALVVTPNLVNETNYVMTTEYPKARETKKKVLPAQLVPTDKSELDRLYVGIPEVIDSEDSHRLKTALIDSLKSIAHKENDSDPKHNYFIGLAYLNGIDVETDRDRAISLITSAAESGLPEAMEKLAGMYENGEGVKLSYEKAIYWRKKLTDIYRTLYENEYTCENAKTYLQSVLDLCQIYKESDSDSSIEKLGDLSHSAIDDCGKSYVQFGDIFFHKVKPDFYNYLGVYYKKCGTEKQLEDAYTTALMMYLAEDIAKTKVTLDSLMVEIESDTYGYVSHEEIDEELEFEHERKMLLSELNLASIKRRQKNYKEAYSYGSRAIDSAEKLADKAASPVDLRNLSMSYARYSYSLSDNKRFDEALEYLNKSLELVKKLAEDLKLVQYMPDLIINLTSIAGVYEEMKNYSAAEKYYHEAYRRASEHVERSENTKDRSRLASICKFIANLYQYTQKPEEAEKYFIESKEINEKLFSETGSLKFLDEIWVCCFNLGSIMGQLKNNDKANEYYTLALDRVKVLFEQTKNGSNAIKAGMTYNRLGDIASAKEEKELAEYQYLNAVIYYEAVNSLGEKEESDLIDLYTNIIDVSDDAAAVCKYLMKRAALKTKHYEILIGREKGDRLCEDCIREYLFAAKVSIRRENYEAAEKAFKSALEMAGKIKSTFTSVSNNDNRVKAYTGLGDIATHNGFITVASEYYSKALEYCDSDAFGFLDYSHSTPESLYQITELLRKLSESFLEDEETDQAKKYYDKAVDAGEKLLKDRGEDCDHYTLAQIYEGMGSLYKKRKFFKMSAQLMEGVVKSNPDNSDYYELYERVKKRSKLFSR